MLNIVDIHSLLIFTCSQSHIDIEIIQKEIRFIDLGMFNLLHSTKHESSRLWNELRNTVHVMVIGFLMHIRNIYSFKHTQMSMCYSNLYENQILNENRTRGV